MSNPNDTNSSSKDSESKNTCDIDKLIIMDDCAPQHTKFDRSDEFTDPFRSGRHYDVSTIYPTDPDTGMFQKMMDIPKDIRVNCDFVVIPNPPSNLKCKDVLIDHDDKVTIKHATHAR